MIVGLLAALIKGKYSRGWYNECGLVRGSKKFLYKKKKLMLYFCPKVLMIWVVSVELWKSIGNMTG